MEKHKYLIYAAALIGGFYLGGKPSATGVVYTAPLLGSVSTAVYSLGAQIGAAIGGSQGPNAAGA